MLPDYDNVMFTDGFKSDDTLLLNRQAAWYFYKQFRGGRAAPQEKMIRTSRDICQKDVLVSSLDYVPPQANAAKHRSADGLLEPRRYIIRYPPTGDFPGLDDREYCHRSVPGV